MNKFKQTPDFGQVTASTLKLDNQCYRAVVKNALGQVVFVSIDTFRNRDTTTSIYDSARDIAKGFIENELKAEGAIRYREGIYEYSYKGPAPFYDLYCIEYECLNGYWARINGEYKIPTRSIPASILKQAAIQ